jgi:hypothetical protein
MTTDPTEIAVFLEARLAEEEADARAANPGPWLRGTEREHLVDEVLYGQSTDWHGYIVQVCNVEMAHNGEANADHIARQNPAVTLARCAALRGLVAFYESFPKCGDGDPDDEPPVWMKHAAAIYRYRPDGSQYPDWREEWAKETDA